MKRHQVPVVLAATIVAAHCQSMLHRFFIEDVKNCPSQIGAIDVSSIKIRRMSRVTVGMSGNIVIKEDLPNDTLMSLSIDKLTNKRWIPMMVHVSGVKVCDFVDKDRIFYPHIQQLTSLPPSCPFVKIKQHQIFFELIDNCPSAGSIVDVSSLKVTRVNRHTLGFKGTITVKADILDDTWVSIDIFTLSKMRWQLLTRAVSDIHMCTFIKEDKFFYGNLQPYSDLPASCPFKKGNYTVNNAIIRPKVLPLLPLGCYKIEITTRNSMIKGYATCIRVVIKLAGPNASPNPRCT